MRPHGFPVPEVLWLETVPSSLGRPYFVMERDARRSRSDGPTRGPRRPWPSSWARRSPACTGCPVEGLALGFEPPASGGWGARAELARWRERYLAERLDRCRCSPR